MASAGTRVFVIGRPVVLSVVGVTVGALEFVFCRLVRAVGERVGPSAMRALRGLGLTLSFGVAEFKTFVALDERGKVGDSYPLVVNINTAYR